MLWAKVRSLVRSILGRTALEEGMTDEIRFHIESRANDLAAKHGLSRNEALRKARIEFGSLEKHKEEARHARGLRFLDELRGDLRYAVRQFSQNKAFSFVTVLMLAIGIGANTWSFNQLNDAMFKPLPVRNPNELRQVWYSSAADTFRRSGNGYQRPDSTHATSFSYPAYQYMRDRTTALSDLFCFSGPQTVNVGVSGTAETATAVLVSGNYFRGLGVQAALGRTLLPNDDQPGEAAEVAVLGYGFWQRVFGGDSAVLGRTLTVNGRAVLIAGVTPRGFNGMNPDWSHDILLPMAMHSVITGGRDVLKNSGNWSFLVFGRLSSGENEDRARLETETLLQQAILVEPPDRSYDPPKVTLAAADRGFRSRDAVSPAVLSASVVGVILLIACANIAGLLLARATARGREIGTRLAIGASRLRIVRQLLTESLILSLAGGTVGITVALAAGDGQPEPDIYVLGFSLALSVFTSLVFGLAPALRATRLDLVWMLKQASTRPVNRYSGFLSGKALVTLQVALSLLLLVGAGLFLRTLFNLKGQALGFDVNNVLVFRMNPSLNGYTGDRLLNFYEDAVKQIQSEPGVLSASISRWGILAGGHRVREYAFREASPSVSPPTRSRLATSRR